MKTTFTVTATVDIDIEYLADSIEETVLENIAESLYYEDISGCAEAFLPAVMTSVIAELTSRQERRNAV